MYIYMYLHIIDPIINILYAKTYNNELLAQVCQKEKKKTKTDTSGIRRKGWSWSNSYKKN